MDRIEIEDPTGRTLKFPCGLWLGGGGPYGAIADSVFERTLKPAAAQQVEKVQLERQLAGPVEVSNGGRGGGYSLCYSLLDPFRV